MSDQNGTTFVAPGIWKVGPIRIVQSSRSLREIVPGESGRRRWSAEIGGVTQ